MASSTLLFLLAALVMFAASGSNAQLLQPPNANLITGLITCSATGANATGTPVPTPLTLNCPLRPPVAVGSTSPGGVIAITVNPSGILQLPPQLVNCTLTTVAPLVGCINSTVTGVLRAVITSAGSPITLNFTALGGLIQLAFTVTPIAVGSFLPIL